MTPNLRGPSMTSSANPADHSVRLDDSQPGLFLDLTIFEEAMNGLSERLPAPPRRKVENLLPTRNPRSEASLKRMKRLRRTL